MKEGGCLGGSVSEQQNLDFKKLIFAWSIDDNNYKVEKEKESLDYLVNRNSVLYKDAKWKVLFSDAFRRSFGMLTCDRLKKLVLNILLRLSFGWRPKRSLGLCQENSSKGLKQFNVEGLYIVCTLDIIKDIQYEQVLKIPKLTKRLENILYAYTEEYINLCTENRFEGYLEVPSCWPASQVMTRFRHLVSDESHNEVSVNPGGGRNYVENSKVSESLLLMKFYLLSYEVVCHLLSGRQVDLPMQVTDEQMDVILFKKSSFIIGRLGTGKTTILTRKLFQNEQRVVNNSVGTYAAENNQLREAEVVHDPDNNKPTVLRQLFVTVSPQLCYAIKQHVSHLTSNSSNGNSSAEIGLGLDDVDITSEFSDIPDTFIDIPGNIYPLVITFHKFLMMLDGTLGNSFFEKFLEAREGFDANRIRSRSIALQTFIRLREVTFDRFCSLYWPRFNSNLTKKLDPSRVFTEIISHIKGGSEGKLSFEGYSLLAKRRSSTLKEQKREIIYTLFKAYEKMKTERGEFDLGDFVNDIHERLRNGNYEGDQIDFVYIDEVQDLSMRQISLFKYICQNVDEGFVFAGDTAQTIAKGIDFRFQDIRSLFYKEFLSTRKSRKEEKAVVSEIKQMKQNYRTHAGVLDLAQSVIDILYCYFVHSIDKLEPETSLISGEAPVFLESCNDKNVIMTIFGGSKSGGEIVGFGAEQVILVRDNRARTEIIEYIGRQALVLTILECKGLEFQDVLLYNFFGTSPLKDQWRVIYGYMKKHNWLDEKLPQSFPTFDEVRHSLLCSELKQLYVAITRTRQRLWICENKEELSKPMFDYWKRKGLVQIRKLDDSMAQAMQVASSPREWQERGKKASYFIFSLDPLSNKMGKVQGVMLNRNLGFWIYLKLFYEKNFGMATICFERAGDVMWLKLAKACGLRASADQIRGTHPESYFGYLREAAGLFESIGKLDSAASCYCDLGEYERAGKIYMHKCGKFDAAVECFTLAGSYNEAAEAAASLNFQPSLEDQPLSEERLMTLPTQHLQENDRFFFQQQKFMFLTLQTKTIGEPVSFDVRFCGFIIRPARVKHSLRIKLSTLMHIEIFPAQTNQSKLEVARWMDLGHVSKISRANPLTLVSIVYLSLVYYDWEDKLPVDIDKFCEDKMFQNRVSVRTLVFYWNLWKKHILDILRSIESLENEEQFKSSGHADFCLYYFGVRKQFPKGNTLYLSLNKDADWIRNTCNKGLQRDEKCIHFDGREMVSAIRSYWQSELLSVGIKVLETLDALRRSKSNGSAFHQSTSLLHIFEVSKFLLDFQCHNLTNPYKKRLQYFLGISLSYLDIVFPLDWRKSVDEDLVSLKETDLSVNLLEEIILQMVDIKALERVIIICLCSRVSVAVYKNLINKLKSKDRWKSFVEKFRDRGLRDVFVARALQHALEHSFGTNSSFLSLHSFGYLLDRLLLMQSFSSRKSYTTRSCFVGSFTHIQSASTLSAGQSSLNLSVIIKRIEDILSSSEFGILMIQRSKIDASYYPLLVLKMVMILSLICLKLPEYSHCLLRYLSGYGNYAYFLPKKFVSGLFRKRKNEELNLDPEVVAEAFSSIDDPLLIISSEDGSPKINAPCAIFVDLRKSKEEIMSVLFPRTNTHNASTSSSTVNAGAIPEGSSSKTLPDTVMNINRVELRMNWKVIEEISEAINEKKGVAPNKLPAATRIMNELDISRATFLLAVAAQCSCTSYTFLKFEKFVFHVNEGLKMLSFAFDTSVPEDLYSRALNSSTVKDLRIVENNTAIFIKEAEVVENNHSIVWKNLRMTVDALQDVRRYVDTFFRNIDEFLNHHVASQVTKVEETGDEASVVLENQSECENTQDGNNEKRKGNNKGKKSNKSKGKKKHY
ncbi:uvrD-like Helicase, ATP-binding domain, P-loop containing nucleoside triphosphate hydrolase [Artemisia annua]|uniref:UvrD-like Helicase, ATP-binding domain, P-loop containing nucleoside triphosphate hydrolase n=1 Tax=Artemisia annua TaxID=35608 RepID=A0A2U1MF69_ARTAN|nr:uvrD-like Helicase, ATP-binding domain, P-loop containing nucleoside triphosphate hydrolase [Artemisia annua]